LLRWKCSLNVSTELLLTFANCFHKKADLHFNFNCFNLSQACNYVNSFFITDLSWFIGICFYCIIKVSNKVYCSSDLLLVYLLIDRCLPWWVHPVHVEIFRIQNEKYPDMSLFGNNIIKGALFLSFSLSLFLFFSLSLFLYYSFSGLIASLPFFFLSYFFFFKIIVILTFVIFCLYFVYYLPLLVDLSVESLWVSSFWTNCYVGKFLSFYFYLDCSNKCVLFF